MHVFLVLLLLFLLVVVCLLLVLTRLRGCVGVWVCGCVCMWVRVLEGRRGGQGSTRPANSQPIPQVHVHTTHTHTLYLVLSGVMDGCGALEQLK